MITLAGISVGAYLSNKVMASSSNVPVCMNCRKKEYMHFLEADLNKHSFACTNCTDEEGENYVTILSHQGANDNGGYCEICDYLYTRELPDCSKCGLNSYMSLKYTLDGKHVFECSECMKVARNNGYERDFGCTEISCEIDKTVSPFYCEEIDSYKHLAHYCCKYAGNCKSEYEITESHNSENGKCSDCNAIVQDVMVVKITK